MAINWYNRLTSDPDDLSLLPDAVDYYESQLEEAREEIKISGGFQRQAAELPGIMEYRFSQLQEIDAILSFLTMKREKAHHKAFKMFLESYNRSLTSRDAERYANADDMVFELSLLVNQINLLKQKFLGVTKGLETKHYQLGYLSRLKAAGLEDYIIDTAQ